MFLRNLAPTNFVRLSLLFALVCCGAIAQTSRGTVTGIVTDPQGATVSGASVALTNQSTNITRVSITNEAGFYRFDAVDLGDYTVSVTLAGFQKSVKRSVVVAGGQTTSVDAQLEIGETQQTVEVVAQSDSLLQYEAPVRGGNFTFSEASQLPLPLRRASSIAFVLPGVSTNRFGAGANNLTNFVVNGARQRSNNFMIDGTENNDISVTGEGLSITNPDTVAEVHVQTSNFDAEFGRAGGGVVNVITKSGGNNFHGSATYILDSTYDDAITNTQSLSRSIRDRGRPPFGIEQWYGATLGGPISRDRTFFFAGFQHKAQRFQQVNNLVTLTSQGRETLNRLYPKGANANVDLYNAITGGVNADANPFTVALGSGRPDLQFGTAIIPSSTEPHNREIVARVDHRLSDRDQLSGRYIINDSAVPKAALVDQFPGFETSSETLNQNASLVETHVFSPTLTNEIRLNYNRLAPSFPADVAHPLALSAPRIQIASGVTSIGLNPAIPQGRTGNNYSLQDAATIIRGAHSLRTGADILVQRSRQYAPIAERGFVDIRAGGGFSAFANFIDDFGGAGGLVQRDFGSAAYYPDMTRTAFFFQDRWRATSSLTLTLGARYEYFGVPINSLIKSSWSGLFNVDPVTLNGPYSQPSGVKPDRNNWSPSVGIAYSPASTSGFTGWLFGNRQTVFRTGYQIGYDSFFNNIASNAQTSTPNIVATLVNSQPSAASPRGFANAIRSIPPVAGAFSPADAQNLVAGDLVNPYVQRWSFGIQRALPGGWVTDISYVGSKGTRLFINEDLNPAVPDSLRITPANVSPRAVLTGNYDNIQGNRTIRTNAGASNFHSLQISASRRLANGLAVTAAYTWAKNLDNASEIFGLAATNQRSTSAVPSIFGGQHPEKGLSLFHREQRATFTWVYELPFYRSQKSALGRVLGGWQLSGFATFETGVPITVTNGFDADGISGPGDRPLFNPSGQRGVRAVPRATSPTGYINPDDGNAPIDPARARYIGLPAHDGRPGVLPTGNLGRNTEFLPGMNNFDVNLQKNIRISEGLRAELRGEFFNVLNHPQYGTPSISPFSPGQQGIAASVGTSPAGRFLQPQFADGGGRVVRYQVKLVF